MLTSKFEKAAEAAVAPGPDRLLAGFTVGAAGIKGGNEEHLQAFGDISVNSQSRPATVDTVVRLASCSKLLTTVAALQCVERGQIDLHSAQDVEKLIPEWAHLQVLAGMKDGQPQLHPIREKITLHRLLTHSSGLMYDFYPQVLQWRASRGEGSLAMCGEMLKAYLHPLAFEPGSAWGYGPSVDVAGLMVARANSCTLEQYMRKHIFMPLDMNSTSFHPLSHGDMSNRMMPMTTRSSDGTPLQSGEHPSSPTAGWPLDPKDDCGGSGIYSTARDYLQPLKSLLRNDGKLLKAETVDAMFSPQLSTESSVALTKMLSNEALARYIIPGFPAVGKEGSGEWNFGLGGILGQTAVSGRLQAGWLQWGGSPNLKWWIDRNGGTCGIFATQLSPPGEGTHQELTLEFQRAVCHEFGS